jgi:hypothetical protein
MKGEGVVLILSCLLAALVASLGSGAAEVGAVRCLRAGRTNNFTVCLSCHDGSLAYNFKLTASPMAQDSTCSEHPVALSYATVYARQPREFVPPGLLDPQVQLINGEVQCLTCHTTTTNGDWVPLHLSGNRPLCLSCHRK